MEPPSRLQPKREQQLVLCSPFITVETLPTSATEHHIQTQKQTQEHVVRISQYTKSSPPLISRQTFMQPSTQKNLGTLTTVNRSTTNNTNDESSPALASTAATIKATTQAATGFSGSSLGHNYRQHHHQTHHQQPGLNNHPSHGSDTGFSGFSQLAHQQTIEKLSRPMAFDKMEVLVREMQDQEHGVPVRQQKMFLTSIPYAFMGYDLIEWLMDHLQIEESEALNIANQLCLHGYFFPVNDSKTLTVKDDSSLYRFQTPYYWPWQHKAPDNVEYAIYLAKRSLRNKQRHALEDYEAEAFASLHKNLKGKWDFISMQAEEQVRLAKERKKGDKIVGDSQERAYWRVHRPPPGQFTPLEPCPVPSRDRQGQKPNKKKTVDDIQREVEFLSKTLNRTRMKMSQACESLVSYSETFYEYDFFLQPALPSNPWVTEDITFWQLNNTFVDIPTEKRVKRWAISIEELVSDPTGLQEFTMFLEKEYSHENIRFWIAVNRLRRAAHSQVARNVNEIFEEFLKPGAPCEINIDGKTMESVLRGLQNPSRFTFDSASEHIYMLLLKKDCYPRFIRSDHYKRLIDSGIQPSHKKRFFNFGTVSGAKKKMTAALSSQPNVGEVTKNTSTAGTACGICPVTNTPPSGNLARRRGSDRSLSGSALELAVIAVDKSGSSKVPHSHSQNNVCELSYRESPNIKLVQLDTSVDIQPALSDIFICPWDEPNISLASDVPVIPPNNINIAVLLPSRSSSTNVDELSMPFNRKL
ncbi:regulator of G-protein signaling 7 isoform X5 [Drosophila hydei]|uniref:Regulator of G-protein signaling 7 isoform X5 n=1 Tax=Drosophila hydei TaxID=7224 RepID=A0A6J2SUM2_DROHY|nr:regulator of G-protein signaling 7 isoform X5 [Drosophila hydei]